MERLTYYIEPGTAATQTPVQLHAEVFEQITQTGPMLTETKFITGEIVARLAAYEDTGLEPGEIMAQVAKLRQIEEEKAQAARVAAMVDLATHAIGMSNKKTYKRHGQTWYKPYRNFYCAGTQGDPVWDEMVKQGYAEASKGLSSVYYFMTRAGLDWLGEQTGINIHDEER